jgi:hypothetical protein
MFNSLQDVSTQIQSFKFKFTLPVLVNKHEVEPIILVAWHIHFHPIGAKFKVHARILYVSDSIKPKVGRAFTKEDRPNSDAFLRALRSVGQR